MVEFNFKLNRLGKSKRFESYISQILKHKNNLLLVKICSKHIMIVSLESFEAIHILSITDFLFSDISFST